MTCELDDKVKDQDNELDNEVADMDGDVDVWQIWTA